MRVPGRRRMPVTLRTTVLEPREPILQGMQTRDLDLRRRKE